MDNSLGFFTLLNTWIAICSYETRSFVFIVKHMLHILDPSENKLISYVKAHVKQI